MMKPGLHIAAMMLLATIAAAAGSSGTALAETPLRIIYFERPPHYYTYRGEAQGVLVERTRTIMAEAGMRATFVKIPVKRIINEIQTATTPVCSIGWFKTAERLAFASFTLPIYQDRPLVVLTTRDKHPRIAGYAGMDALLADMSQTLGVVSGFSYGSVVDRMMANRHSTIESVTGNLSQLLKMLDAGRVDYLILSPEGIPGALRAVGLNPENFDTVEFQDVPPGNPRYLMCSQSVPEAVIDGINKAILRIRLNRSAHRYPEPVWDAPTDYRP
ncbi:MAG: transporter substrate-binding domain-containing protein [Pseudomonadota bacterium]